MSNYLCKVCNQTSSAEEWNEKTREILGDPITTIDYNPEFMYCPKCGGQIYDWDFEESE